jgi:hypothetical protein
VTTDGDSDTAPVVVVHLPLQTGFVWVVNSTWESQTFSSKGGAVELGAETPVVAGPGGSSREFTAHIWRFDTSAAIYLHCAFDTDGFSSSRPMSCTAFST